MGIKNHSLVEKLVFKIENAISKDYYEKIQYRVLKSNPEISINDFLVRWFELKRYFILKAIFPELSMYSKEVDEIWHEMLMFTREYQDFSERFLGSMLHHNPHIEENIEDFFGKGWFDWAYLQLFHLEPFSWHLWHGFLFHKLNPGIENLLRSGQVHEIEKIFNTQFIKSFPEGETFLKNVIDKLLN